MKENEIIKNYMNINKDIKKISDLIIQKYNIKNHCCNTEIENWLTMRITTITNNVSDEIKEFNNKIYKQENL